METLGDNLVAKSGKKWQKEFYCENCDYLCYKKYNWEKHLMTAKHSQVTLGDNFVAKVAKSGKNEGSIFICDFCDKEYSSRNGLWKHKKTCKENDDISTKQLVMLMLQQNNKVQDALIEMSKQITTTNNTNNMTNSHNQTTNNSFNLQLFLNETCKNAMNIMDFAQSIQLQLSDLEAVGEAGYVEGISNIIVKKLKSLDITERPIHCADKKREVIYIKDQDKWEKDDDDKKKLRKVINEVACKNQRLLPKFKELHPGCNFSESKYADHYSKLVIEAMGGSGDNDEEKTEKIIRNIAKEVVIDKNSSLFK